MVTVCQIRSLSPGEGGPGSKRESLVIIALSVVVCT